MKKNKFVEWMMMWFNALWLECDEKEKKIIGWFGVSNLIAWLVIFVMIFKYI